MLFIQSGTSTSVCWSCLLVHCSISKSLTNIWRSCPIDYLCVVYTFGFSSSRRGGPRGPLLDITNFISVKVQTKRQWGTVIYIFSYVLHKFNSCLGATLRERYVLFNCRTTALWICEILLKTSQKSLWYVQQSLYDTMDRVSPSFYFNIGTLK